MGSRLAPSSGPGVAAHWADGYARRRADAIRADVVKRGGSLGSGVADTTASLGVGAPRRTSTPVLCSSVARIESNKPVPPPSSRRTVDDDGLVPGDHGVGQGGVFDDVVLDVGEFKLEADEA
jgi:hypothetical protein